jgi:hypothetical protein
MVVPLFWAIVFQFAFFMFFMFFMPLKYIDDSSSIEILCFTIRKSRQLLRTILTREAMQ